MATIAGYKAVLVAAGTVPRLFPMLTTAANTIAPARAFVIGAGVAGHQNRGSAGNGRYIPHSGRLDAEDFFQVPLQVFDRALHRGRLLVREHNRGAGRQDGGARMDGEGAEERGDESELDVHCETGTAASVCVRAWKARVISPHSHGYQSPGRRCVTNPRPVARR